MIQSGYRSVVQGLFVAIMLLCAAAFVHADTFTWTGAGGDNNWNNADNWLDPLDMDRIPGAGDDVVFNIDAETTNGTADLATITSGSTFSLAPGALILADINNAGTFTFAGGITTQDETLRITGDTMLTGGGEFIFVDNDSVLSIQTGGSTFTNVDNLIRSTGGGQINAPIINQHIIRVEGGTLNITSDVDNTGGTIEIKNGATINLSSGSITGGQLDTEAGGLLDNGTLSNVTTSGTLAVAPGAVILQNTITNTGTITFAGAITTQDEAFRLDGPVMFTGGGELVFIDNDSVLDIQTGGSTLTNVDNVIRSTGGGHINAPINNQHIIRAETGTLNIASDINNTGGTVEIKNGATINLSSGSIDGGDIDSEAGGQLEDGTLSNVTTSGTLAIAPGVTILQNTITNTDTITFANNTITTQDEALRIDGPVMLTGGGEMVFIDNDSVLDIQSGGSTLTNVDNVIRGVGGGHINAPINNQHIIRAEAGTLNIASDINNTGGTVEIKNNATLNLSSGSISGGEIDAEADGQLEDGTLSNVTTSGTLAIAPGVTILQNTITNTDTITFANNTITTQDETLRIDGPVTLDGGGELVFVDNDSMLSIQTAGSTLTNVDNIIRGGGGGHINAPIINQHIIRADSGTLNISGDVTNTDGVIEVKDGATLNLSNSIVTGGVIDGEVGGQVEDGTLNNVTTSGTYAVAPGVTILQNTITNTGTITFANNTVTSQDENLRLDGSVMLTGGGEIVFNNNDSTISIQTAGSTLTNVDNTLRGGGGASINAPLANQHVLHVDNGTLNINAELTNTGTVIVEQSAELDLSTTLINQAGGVIAGEGTITGNTIESNGQVSPGQSPGTLTFDVNTYTQSADASLLIELAGDVASGQFDHLIVDGTANLAGELIVDLLPGFTGEVGDRYVVLTADQVNDEGLALDTTLAFGQPMFSLDITGSEVALVLDTIPEPTSLIALTALFTLLPRRRQ